jgi:hypothetical protein
MRMHTAASYALANQTKVKGAEVQLVASKPFLFCPIGPLGLESYLLNPPFLELMQIRRRFWFPTISFCNFPFFPFLYFFFLFLFLTLPLLDFFPLLPAKLPTAYTTKKKCRQMS